MDRARVPQSFRTMSSPTRRWSQRQHRVPIAIHSPRYRRRRLGRWRQRRRRGIFVESSPKWKPRLRRSGIILMMSPRTGLRIIGGQSLRMRSWDQPRDACHSQPNKLRLHTNEIRCAKTLSGTPDQPLAAFLSGIRRQEQPYQSKVNAASDSLAVVTRFCARVLGMPDVQPYQRGVGETAER
jgi:hypothetical protein